MDASLLHENLRCLMLDSGKHHFEAVGIVSCAGLEAVAWGLQQVDVGTSDGVDKVQVAEYDVFVAEAQREAAIFFSHEINWHLANIAGKYGSAVLAIHGHVDLATVLSEAHLAEVLSFTEDDEGVVNTAAIMIQAHVELTALSRSFSGDGEGLSCSRSLCKETFHASNWACGGDKDGVD